jgi:hypothetical protein
LGGAHSYQLDRVQDGRWGALRAAWEHLFRTFRDDIQCGKIYLAGVQTFPLRQIHREPINGLWAADFQFDLLNGAIAVAGSLYRYVAVVALRTPFDAVPTDTGAPWQLFEEQLGEIARQAPAAAATPRAFNVSDLSDEQIGELLEEHARRVAEGTTSQLMPPGKVSLIPLIRRHLQHRATAGQQRETLSAEAHELHEWISGVAPSYHVPSAGTIENNIRSEYRALKPRSNPTIQSDDV